MVVLVVLDSEVVHILQFDDLAWLEGRLAEIGAVRTAESVAQTALKWKNINEIDYEINVIDENIDALTDEIPFEVYNRGIKITNEQ